MTVRSTTALLLTATLLPELLLSGCASSDTTGNTASGAPGREECLRARAVRTYDAMDDQHIWVEESASRQFLLTLYSRCPDISTAQAIAFTNMMSICPNNPGSVTFRNETGGLRCDIRTVERVGSRGEAEAIVDDRRRLGQ